MEFKEGNVYISNPNIVPGMYNHSSMKGFHMSEELSNVFRFFDISKEGIEIAQVTGFGECRYFEDEYNGYYDMYVCQNIKINKFLTREEYIDIILHESEIEVMKFIKTFPMNSKEKILFMRQFRNNIQIIEAMFYYQYGVKDIYERKDRTQILSKVMNNGQNSSQRGKGK